MSELVLRDCGVLYLDHIAVTTADFDHTVREYLSLPGARLVKGPGVNPTQNVEYAFVRLDDGVTVEVLGVRPDSPISRHVEQGGGAYHLCYAVDDLDSALAHVQSRGGKVIVPATEDVAFDKRRIAFLWHSHLGLFELVEAVPQRLRIDVADEIAEVKATGHSRLTVVSPGRSTSDHSDQAIHDRLTAVFCKVFPTLDGETALAAEMANVPGWDSLAHIRLMMEVEAEFGVDLPMDEIVQLDSYQVICDKLEDLIGEKEPTG